MTLGDLIKEYRETNNLSMDAFADIAGISKGYISMLEKNKNPRTGKPITPSIKIVNAVVNAMKTDIDTIVQKLDDDYKFLINENIDPFQYNNIYPISTQKIRLLGDIACGEPIYADEDRESYVEAGTDIKADFCLRCKGDSMINARIMDGDIVFIRKQKYVENGEIAAVQIEDEATTDYEATLKRVYYYPDKELLILRPENPKYKDFVFSENEINKVRILGKAIAFQSDIN